MNRMGGHPPGSMNRTGGGMNRMGGVIFARFAEQTRNAMIRYIIRPT